MNWKLLAGLCLALGVASAQPAALVLAADPAAASPSAGPASAPKAQTGSDKLTGTKVALDTAPRRKQGDVVPGWLVLTATLTTADGKPLSERSVSFYQTLDLIGTRDSLLGSATTDTTGSAAILFQAPEAGTFKLKAAFGGDSQFAPAQGAATADVKDAGLVFPSEPAPLASVASWLAIAARVLGVAVWVVLLSVLFRATLGMRAAARSVEAEYGPAWTASAQESAERSSPLST